MTTQPPKGPTPAQFHRGPRVVVRKVDPSVAEKEKDRAQRKYIVWGMGAVAGLVVVWAAWSLCGGWFQSTPPDPEKVSGKELATYLASDKFDALSDDMKDEYSKELQRLPADKRREMFGAEGVSQEDRQKIFGAISRARQKQQAEDIRKFFALSPEDRAAELDRRIAEEDARRASFRDNGGRPPRPDSADNSTRAGGGTGGPGAPGGFGRGGGAGGPPDAKGGGRRGGPTADQFQRGMERRLDGTTPEDRAYTAEYRRLMQQRRQQLQAQKK